MPLLIITVSERLGANFDHQYGGFHTSLSFELSIITNFFQRRVALQAHLEVFRSFEGMGGFVWCLGDIAWKN